MLKKTVSTFLALVFLSDITGAYATSPADALEIDLSPSNMPSQSIPPGKKGAKILSLNIGARCDGDRTVEQMILAYESPGQSREFPIIYASVNGRVVTNKSVIDVQDLTVVLNFKTPLHIQACRIVQVDILGDFPLSAAHGSRHSLMLALPSDVVSDATSLIGRFPFRSNVFTVRADIFDRYSCYRNAQILTTSALRRQARAACRRK